MKRAAEGATSVGEFIRQLRAVKLRAGDPSLAELRRRTGIPVSTLYDALKPDRRRLPSLDLVRALVRACDERPQTVARFESAWYALKQAQDAPAGAASTSAASAPSAEQAASPYAYVPRQLPAPIQGFAGREGYQEELDGALLEQAPSVAVLTGTAGVGKTSLAVSWAQRAAGRFPDGQLFLDLRGHAAAPALAADQALSLLLQSLGVAGESIPVDLELQIGLYRSLLAERRLLLVLDNAAGVEQVRPLLPGSAGCHVVVTSRNTLGGLVVREGARRISLDVLDEEEALDLLRVQLGTDRVDTEAAAARRLAGSCAHLPLALRIAAANLAGRPTQSLERFTADLHGAERLAKLQVTDDPDVAVAAAFDLSYDALAPGVQRVFRYIGLMPGPELTRAAVAVLSGLPPEAPVPELDSLAAAHLLDAREPGRFRCHDLLRLYAGQCARHELSRAERTEAVHRLYSWYLLTADAAARLLHPSLVRLERGAFVDGVEITGVPTPLGSREQARAWLDEELPNLLAAIRHAADAGPRPVSWHLVDALRGWFTSSGRDLDWLASARAALDAAEAEERPEAVVAVLNSLAWAADWQGEPRVAEQYLRRALALCEGGGGGSGDGGGGRDAGPDAATAQWLGGTLNNLGQTLHGTGELAEAAHYVTRARDALDGAARVVSVLNLAHIYRDLGRLDDALALTRQADALAGDPAPAGLRGAVLRAYAGIRLDQGDHEAAAGLYDRALTGARDAGMVREELDILAGIAVARSRAGRHADALARTDEVLALAASRKTRGDARNVLVAAVDVLLASGRTDDAVVQAGAALRVYRTAGQQLQEARVHLLLGKALAARDGRDAAEPHWRRALEIAHRTGAVEAAELSRLLAGD